MKRFMVFCGSIYYPSGGMEDFKKDFEDVFEAIRYGQAFYFDDDYLWFQVYDLVKNNYVYEKNYSEDCETYYLEKEQFMKTNLDLPLV